MRSSHVGSFPLGYSLENVGRVLKDLAAVGVDVPPYPQMRGFIDIYVNPLLNEGLAYLIGNFIYADPTQLMKQRVKHTSIPEAEYAIQFVKEAGLGFKGLRAPVTGAFTLSSRVYVVKGSVDLTSTALARKELLQGFFVGYVGGLVKYMSSLGYDVVFMDEPSLTLVIGARKNLFNYSDDEVIEALNNVAKESNNAEVGIHVCGRIHKRLFEVLTRVPKVRYLSFEFHDNPGNLEVIDKHLLESYDKVISPGVVSSKKPVVEELSEVLNILKKVVEKAGGRVDLIAGDCGFAGLRGSLGDVEREYRLSLAKLEKVVKAVKTLSQT